MTRLLVTGADGFVGRWLVRAALARQWEVIAAIAPDGDAIESWLTPGEAESVEVVEGDLRDERMIAALAARAPAAVAHLAAISSGLAAREYPMLAWTINAGVTAKLAEAFANAGHPRFLLVSTGEVYGRGHFGPITEDASLLPISPYAATKVGAECAVLENWRRTALPVVIARPFPHTGPGQSETFVLPALARRLRQAAASGASTIPVGNLEPVRDLLDVRDVVTAYLGLIEKGEPGEAYNVASGKGIQLSDAFQHLARLTGSSARPVADPALLRTADLDVLIGDATKIRECIGWTPEYSVDRTLQDLVDAQAD